MTWHAVVAATEELPGPVDHEGLSPEHAAELAEWWRQAFQALENEDA